MPAWSWKRIASWRTAQLTRPRCHCWSSWPSAVACAEREKVLPLSPGVGRRRWNLVVHGLVRTEQNRGGDASQEIWRCQFRDDASRNVNVNLTSFFLHLYCPCWMIHALIMINSNPTLQSYQHFTLFILLFASSIAPLHSNNTIAHHGCVPG